MNFNLSNEDVDVLLDALKKGASRHSSYAKFYQNRSTAKHEKMATAMTKLSRRLAQLREAP